MRQTGKRLTAAGAVFLLLAGLGLIHLRAQQNIDEQEGGDIGVLHAECSFLGKERDQFLTIGLGADLAAMTKSSELTTAVAAALSSGARLSRGRVSSSPLAGSTIDTAIFAGLQSQGIAAASVSTDTEFLRRVTLDLTGRIPTAQEVIDFLNDPAPGKRDSAIDRLLATPQWADRWAMFFGDLYRNTTVTAQVNRYPDGRDAYHLFLKNSLLENKPYDQMAREMLTASGVSDGRYYPDEFASYQQYLDLIGDYQGNPVKPTAASYIVGGRVTGGPIHDTYDGMAVNVARDFLGLSHMDCILCHDGKGHLDSLSVWGAQATRLQAWQLAAFFTQTGLSRPLRTPPRPNGAAGVVPRWWIVGPNPRNRPYRLNTTTGNRPSRQPADAGGLQVVDPVYPFGGAAPSAGANYREALAGSLTADPQFARAIVNYIWKAFFSRGLVEPVDQFDLGRIDPSNPPPQPWEIQSPHAGLLNKLAQAFAANGFDLKWLMREMARSQAYQFSSQYDGVWNPAYEEYFGRHQVRRLSAEEIHDALVLSTGVFEPYTVSPTIGAVAFAMQFPDVEGTPRAGGRNSPSGAAVALLDAFLRGNREETARSGEATILQALQLMNSSLVLNRVDSSKPNPALAAILQQPDNTAIQFLYLTVLSRPPSQAELTAGVQMLAAGNRTQKIEDLMWGLYNKVDFIFNY